MCTCVQSHDGYCVCWSTLNEIAPHSSLFHFIIYFILFCTRCLQLHVVKKIQAHELCNKGISSAEWHKIYQQTSFKMTCHGLTFLDSATFIRDTAPSAVLYV